jgi:ubiquinone/menaquinone biosynthesis C-methylase UbiE
MDWHSRYTQQARWTSGLRRYIFSQIDLPAACRILEVGCGTGAVLQALPDDLEGLDGAAGHSRQMELFGLDTDPDTLTRAYEEVPTACLVRGDAHRLPFTGGGFELVFCHFLLLWVDRPLAVLREMYRLTRQGGWVAAFAEPDYGGRIDFPEELSVLGRLQEQSLIRQGADPRLGRQLKALFRRAGFSEVESGLLGAQWRSDPSREALDLEWEVLASDLQGLLEPPRLDDLRKTNTDAWQSGVRTLFVPTFYAFGRVPPGVGLNPGVGSRRS